MRSHIVLISVFLVAFVVAASGHAQSCAAPPVVCAAAQSVVKISSYEPTGSAVVIGPERIVTNRHMLADNTVAEVMLSDGRKLKGTVIATDYPGDLVTLMVPGLPELPILPVGQAGLQSTLYVIGFDVGRDAVRVYAPGALLVEKADTSLARLHHDARSLPGNSGGALLDAEGRLVGIVASGGEGRNEAIPAADIDVVINASGPDKMAASADIGRAYVRCVEFTDDMRNARGTLANDNVILTKDTCLATQNRQLMDVAATELGMRRKLDPALELLRASYTQDPNAPNTLIPLAVTLHLAQRFEEEVPILYRALEILPTAPQLLRLALQAGIWGGDQALADLAMQRIQDVMPQMAPAARRFYDNPPPKPRMRPPG